MASIIHACPRVVLFARPPLLHAISGLITANVTTTIRMILRGQAAAVPHHVVGEHATEHFDFVPAIALAKKNVWRGLFQDGQLAKAFGRPGHDEAELPCYKAESRLSAAITRAQSGFQIAGEVACEVRLAQVRSKCS